MAQEVGQLVPVLGVAHGAGGHADDGLGAVPVEQLAVAGDGVDDALDGRVAEPSAGLEALAEPGDGGLPFDLGELAAVHVGDEQSRRVGAEVDHADARRGHATARYCRRPAFRAENPGPRVEVADTGW